MGCEVGRKGKILLHQKDTLTWVEGQHRIYPPSGAEGQIISAGFPIGQ